MVQFTEFKCGGVSIGVGMSHPVADGSCVGHLMSEWARLCRGEPLGSPPCLDRGQLLRSGGGGEPAAVHSEFDQEPPLLVGQTDNEQERKKKTTVAMLRLSKSQVEKLKNKANDGRSGRPYTRFETVTGHIWRTACKARKLTFNQPTGIAVSVDVRNRMQPPLPDRYLGNAAIDIIQISHSGELMSKPLHYAASLIREAIEKVDHKYVMSKIDYLKSQTDVTEFQDLRAELGNSQGQLQFFGNPNLSVVSWLTLPITGIDFGWGKEICVLPAGSHIGFDGDSFIIPDRSGDGSLVVAICLHVQYMEDFKKIFYQDVVQEPDWQARL